MNRPPALTGGLWAVLVCTWTYLLLEPKPVPDRVFDGFSWFDKEMLKFVLAKALHLGVYAFLAWLGAAWAGPRRKWVWGFLVLHGVGTEIGQMYVPNRFGSVRDMLIDAAGVAIGAYAAVRFSRAVGR